MYEGWVDGCILDAGSGWILLNWLWSDNNATAPGELDGKFGVGAVGGEGVDGGGDGVMVVVVRGILVVLTSISSSSILKKKKKMYECINVTDKVIFFY
jgi:hypothetical protein